jgi:phosphoglucosamine mutase
MKRQYFGTDGIRGPYGGAVINEIFATRVGFAAGAWWKKTQENGRVTTATTPDSVEKQNGGKRVLIGRDPRYSGAALEQAVIAGLRASGMAPISLGIIPTPAVSRAVRLEGAALGVVLTASHNPAGDNGIKFFGAGGIKLTDEQEAEIEQEILGADVVGDPAGEQPGGSPFEPGAREQYIAASAALLPANSLRGWKIVLDTANGATCGTSPLVLRGLGAELSTIGDEPDGRNINAGVGSEHPEQLCARVRATGARLGIAHDGDGDRCVLCDERGDVLDGDEILTILALHALAHHRLAQRTLVVTQQSNLGVDAALAAAGGRVIRTPIGDRYVSEAMRAEGAMLGGESSGHVICADVSPTGDGLVAALKVIAVMLETGRPLSALRLVLSKFPQRTLALEVSAKRPLETLSATQAAIHLLEVEVGARGRVLVRFSGTESKLRLLVEGETDGIVAAGIARLEAAARADLDVIG